MDTHLPGKRQDGREDTQGCPCLRHSYRLEEAQFANPAVDWHSAPQSHVSALACKGCRPHGGSRSDPYHWFLDRRKEYAKYRERLRRSRQVCTKVFDSRSGCSSRPVLPPAAMHSAWSGLDWPRAQVSKVRKVGKNNSRMPGGGQKFPLDNRSTY